MESKDRSLVLEQLEELIDFLWLTVVAGSDELGQRSDENKLPFSRINDMNSSLGIGR